MTGSTRILLLDLDGTIIDSSRGIAEGAQAVLEEFGLPPLDDEGLRSIVGPPLVESFARLGIAPENIEAAVRRYRELYSTEGIFHYDLYDGITSVITEMSHRGWQLGVATLKPQRFAQRIIEHAGFTPYFSTVAGAQSDHSGETKADIIRGALTSLTGASNVGTVMVGDREQDASGAGEVGTGFIGALWGFGSADELLRANQHARLAHHPEELLTLLD